MGVRHGSVEGDAQGASALGWLAVALVGCIIMGCMLVAGEGSKGANEDAGVERWLGPWGVTGRAQGHSAGGGGLEHGCTGCRKK